MQITSGKLSSAGYRLGAAQTTGPGTLQCLKVLESSVHAHVLCPGARLAPEGAA